MDEIAIRLETKKPFDQVAGEIEKIAAENQFRVLAVHDVQATLAEKGLMRGPLKIIEVCNSDFAHQVLDKDINASLFMPCKFTVCTEDDKTIVNLARPSMIARLLPQAKLEDMAGDIENRLKAILEKAI